jgi:hypothetical protein
MRPPMFTRTDVQGAFHRDFSFAAQNGPATPPR